MHFAILDTGPGFLQWLGEAESLADAVKQMLLESPGCFDDMSPDDDAIHVYSLSSAQAQAVQAWADSDSLRHEFPAPDDGRIYTVAEVRSMV